MTHTISVRRAFSEIGRLLEHFAVVVIGLVMMVVGLGLSVTIVLLPAGVVLGLAGCGIFVAGLFGHLDAR